MKRSIACLLACSGLLFAIPAAAQLPENGSRISVLNGFNTFANSSSKDSIFFLKGGINLGVQGNYYWKSLGIAGRIGYFTNNASEGKVADFGLSRKAVPDRALIATKPYKGFYWMAGPSFQTTFSRWQVESTVLGGLFHHDDAGIYIGDRTSDIIYYRNKIEAGSAFAWNVGFGLNYAISSLFGLGVSADYMSTQSDVVNTDINRNGGAQQALTEQANFLSTALKLTYSLDGSRNVRKPAVAATKRATIKTPFQAGDKPTAAQKTTTTTNCDCENKVMDVAYMEPLTIDITFNTLPEAQEFLKSTSPLYDDKGLETTNPMSNREAGSGMATGRRQYKPMVANFDDLTNTFELNGKYYVATARERGSGIATGKRSSIAIDESGVHRGMMVRNSNGEQVFAMLPTMVNLEQLSYLEGSAISVHVQNGNQLKLQNNNTVRSNRTDNALISNKDDQDGQPNVLKAQNNNTVRSNRTDNALIDNKNSDDNDGLLDIVLYMNGGKATAKIFKNKLKNFFEEGDQPTGEQYTARDAATGRPTGRRQYEPLKANWDEETDMVMINDQYYANVIIAREAGSGMATGRRQYKPVIVNYDDGTGTLELNGQYYAVVAPRDAASGRPTGRRMHKPETIRFSEEEDVIEMDGVIYQEVKTAREAGSGMATGRMKTSFAVLLGSPDSAQSQRLLPTVNKKTLPIRIIAGDEGTAKAIVTNNTQRGGSATLNSQSSSTRQTQGTSFGERVRNGVATGAGAAAGAAMIAGDPIPGLDVKLKRMSDGMIINAVTDENGLIAMEKLEAGEYEVQTINSGKWNNAAVAVKVEAETILLKADTDGDGVTELFPSKTVNTSRGNIKSQQMAAAQSDKPITHVHGDPHVDQKDGYRSTGGIMEYAIDKVQPVRCENGACAMTCIIIVNGKEYEAAITSVLKTKHDTVKNSINNIR